MQHIRDVDILYKIKKFLGFGSVVKHLTGNRNTAVFQVTNNRKHLLVLANIFNGNLRSSQSEEQFHI
jgi:glutathione synthase/RimK-type ligase-like ATP-grasp enzyme